MFRDYWCEECGGHLVGRLYKTWDDDAKALWNRRVIEAIEAHTCGEELPWERAVRERNEERKAALIEELGQLGYEEFRAQLNDERRLRDASS